MSSLYEIIDENVSTIKKFGTQKRRVVFKVNDAPDGKDHLDFFKSAVNEILSNLLNRTQSSDKIGATFELDSFKQKLPGYMSFKRADEITFNDVWGILESILQSDPEALSSDTFRLIATIVTPPAGQGRSRNGIYSTFTEECSKRRGIVSIKNTDNLCLPRALVVAKSHIDKALNYNTFRINQGAQKVAAEELMREAAVTAIPTEGAGVNELRLFQHLLAPNYKITVYSYGTKGRNVIYEGATDAEKKINLLYHEGHYNLITSLTSAFACSYFCEHCHTPHDHKDKHRCEKTCIGCGSSPPCARQALLIKCQDCRRDFRSQQCFENHKGRMCQSVKKCEDCFRIINLKNRKQAHVCGEIYCKMCHSHMPENHFCYIQTASKMAEKQDVLFVFFDLETRQEKEIAPDVKLHEANVCVFQQVCPECYDSPDMQICKRCGVREQILKEKCIEGFMTHLLEIRKKFKKVVAIAHNGQAFDTQFILNYTITQTSLKPELIMRGSKILLLELDNLKFIDSLNFFPMALADLPKAFDLPAPKGYFPHMFNTTANAHYVGPLPDVKFYSPDTMKPKAREEFLKWYEANRDTEFDMQRDLVEYCRTDVDILKRACIHFRNLFIKECDVDPFTEAITIASACNLMYRRKFLKENTIGIIPRGGYRRADNHSGIALQWLLWEEQQRGVQIQHAGRQREVIVGGQKVDGLYERQIFQFHGCFYHGCPTCYITRRNEPLHNDPSDTMDMRYEKTQSSTEKLKSMGYNVIEQWECDFKKKLTPEMKELETHPMLLNTPLNPRDAFYGGRTGAAKLKHIVKNGEKIRYVDVCSLYPWVCKYGKFPIGHPKVYVGREECQQFIQDKGGIENINGVVKCTVLPPQNLYHPVLPVKLHKKLLFPLCRTCTEDLNQAECHHSEVERAISGTWIMDEVVTAVRKGYIIQDVQEIWAYDVTQYDRESMDGGLFSAFIDEFLKMKQEASGWPSTTTTCSGDPAAAEVRKQSYVDDYVLNEGILLNTMKIVKNPGLRSLAKLMLNSFWGKFGQRENQSKTSIISEPKEFFDLLANPSVEVNNVQEINDEVIAVSWQHKEEAADLLSSVNVVIAAFVTTQARLKLYSYLDQLGERVLYYDTDSVIYVSKPNEIELPTGNFLGDLTDELEEYGRGSYIIEFVSGGPKNYAYKVYSPTTGRIHVVVKVKGITLNHKAAQQVNFDSMQRLLDGMEDKIMIESSNIRRTADHQLVTRTESKAYRITFAKRRRIDDFDSVPFGYKKARL